MYVPGNDTRQDDGRLVGFRVNVVRDGEWSILRCVKNLFYRWLKLLAYDGSVLKRAIITGKLAKIGNE
jgi:hypothetical protein